MSKAADLLSLVSLKPSTFFLRLPKAGFLYTAKRLTHRHLDSVCHANVTTRLGPHMTIVRVTLSRVRLHFISLLVDNTTVNTFSRSRVILTAMISQDLFTVRKFCRQEVRVLRHKIVVMNY